MQPVSIAFVSLVGVAVAIRVWLARRQIRHARAHRDTVPHPFAGVAAAEEQRRAADYTVAHIRVSTVDHGLEALMLLGWTLGGGLAAADAAWGSLELGAIATGVGVVVTVALVGVLIDVPLRAWRTFGVERRFGFNRTSPGLFALDQLVSAILLIALGGPLAAATLGLMTHAGAAWWLYAWAVWLGFNLLLIGAWPAVIAPLFNRFTPMRDPVLRTEIDGLLADTGFKAAGVYVADSSRRSRHINAYFTGLGRSKRIVLFDTLLDQLQRGEVKAVLAHELGHFRGRHILKSLLVSAAASLVALAALAGLIEQPWFYAGLGLPEGSPHSALAVFALALPLITLLVQPLLTQLSRHHERQADRFAAQQGLAPELASALVKLYRGNGASLSADPIWSRFYDSHPPPTERIRDLIGDAHGATI